MNVLSPFWHSAKESLLNGMLSNGSFIFSSCTQLQWDKQASQLEEALAVAAAESLLQFQDND
jgi:hypothetical protein